MMEQQEKFDRELKDQAKVSEQQMQLFREGKKHLKCLSLLYVVTGVKETVTKHLVEIEESFKIVWKMVDV